MVKNIFRSFWKKCPARPWKLSYEVNDRLSSKTSVVSRLFHYALGASVRCFATLYKCVVSEGEKIYLFLFLFRGNIAKRSIRRGVYENKNNSLFLFSLRCDDNRSIIDDVFENMTSSKHNCFRDVRESRVCNANAARVKTPTHQLLSLETVA